MREPEIGQVVLFQGAPVLILSGSFYSNGRVSNFWTWRNVFPDGTLGPILSGYGDFSECPKKYVLMVKEVQ